MNKTVTVTLPENLVKEVDELTYPGDRTIFIEDAIKKSLQQAKRNTRDHEDMVLINNAADELNEEAEDVLSYQVAV